MSKNKNKQKGKWNNNNFLIHNVTNLVNGQGKKTLQKIGHALHFEWLLGPSLFLFTII